MLAFAIARIILYRYLIYSYDKCHFIVSDPSSFSLIVLVVLTLIDMSDMLLSKM
jgi:hypothetical protein